MFWSITNCDRLWVLNFITINEKWRHQNTFTFRNIVIRNPTQTHQPKNHSSYDPTIVLLEICRSYSTSLRKTDCKMVLIFKLQIIIFLKLLQITLIQDVRSISLRHTNIQSTFNIIKAKIREPNKFVNHLFFPIIQLYIPHYMVSS